MGSINIHLYSDIIDILWKCKIEIIGGLVWGLTVYSYFYKKINIKREIIRLKREAIIFEVIKNNIIVMSENEKYSIKEMFGQMSDEFKAFKTEVRKDIKEMIKLFHDYKISNNERISLLEGNQKVTKRTIAIYVALVGTFIMLAINTYMSFRG